MWEQQRRPYPISGHGGVSSGLCTPVCAQANVSVSDLKCGNSLKSIMSPKTQRPHFQICKLLWKLLCSNNFKNPEKETGFSSNGIFTTWE